VSVKPEDMDIAVVLVTGSYVLRQSATCHPRELDFSPDSLKENREQRLQNSCIKLDRDIDRGELWVFHIAGVASTNRLENQDVTFLIG
jgi:hypothetical protein